jgi:hypothetical protein
VKYMCLACGRSFPYLSAWYWHIVREHPELEPGWARSMRLGLGRKPSLWAVLEDARAAGIVAIIRGRGDGNG